jgi:hypothetical protein
MTRDVSPSVLNSLDDDVVYPFYAIELLFDGDNTLRMWTGQGTLVYDGVSYYGTGQILTVDSVEETTEMSAKGATLTLSAVPPQVLSLALSEPYQGRRCNIFFGMFASGNLLTESNVFLLLEDDSKILLQSQDTGLTQIFSGYMDQMNIDEGPDSSVIKLTVENKLIDLERVRVARFTSSYQKSIYPNDRGLEFIEDLQDKNIVWGRAG